MLFMRFLSQLSFALWLCVFFCVSAYSKERVSIAINTIPGLLDNQDKNTAYTKLVSRLFNMSSTELNIGYFPSTRAGKLFREYKVDCLFPGSKKVHFAEEQIIESASLNTAKAYLIARHPFNLEQVLSDPKIRYSIAFRRGNTFGGTLERLSRHMLFEVNNDIQSFGLLKTERVDFVLAYIPDALEYLTQEDGTSLFYDPQSLFYSQNDSVLCHDNPYTIKFLDELDKHIRMLTESGELDEILGNASYSPVKQSGISQ